MSSPSPMDSMDPDLPKIISETAGLSWEENPPHLEPASKEQTDMHNHWIWGSPGQTALLSNS